MTVLELFSQLSDAGVILDISADGNLVLDGPRPCLTPEVLARVRAHKAELLTLLRTNPANDKPVPCPTCGDTERWPTTRGLVYPTCWLAANEPEPEPVTWIVERNLDPDVVRQALQAYLVIHHGGTMPSIPRAALLSRINLWLEAHGKRPTTLPALRTALGMAEVSKPVHMRLA